MAVSTETAYAESPRESPTYELVPNRIFVGGMTCDTTESDLCKAFSVYGKVKSARIMMGPTGLSRGFGFVTFESVEDARYLQTGEELVVLRDRKLRIGAAKRPIPPINAFNNATIPQDNKELPPAEQCATPVYTPVVTTVPPPMQYQPVLPYGCVPLYVPTICYQPVQCMLNCGGTLVPVLGYMPNNMMQP